MMFNCNGRKLKEETKEQSRQTVSHWTQQFSCLLDTGRLASGADVVLTLESWLCVCVFKLCAFAFKQCKRVKLWNSAVEMKEGEADR